MVKSRKIIVVILLEALMQRNMKPKYILKFLSLVHFCGARKQFCRNSWIIPFRVNDANAYLSVCLPQLSCCSLFSDPWLLMNTHVLNSSSRVMLYVYFPALLSFFFGCKCKCTGFGRHKTIMNKASFCKQSRLWKVFGNIILHQIK